ncbi:thioesterase II family protein [Amycolatopsis sp. NPDC059027]|uniref:thioesterase II family protein n=1 Tax=unclassified Amycolatopsis TaxID=2618356 RepID=UPI003672E9BF
MVLIGQDDPWLRCFTSGQRAAVRLVCFPHAGGTAGFYRDWQTALPPDVELRVVQYPGREERINDPCVDDMAELADRITAAVLPLATRPLVLFGHSMGAAVAYEVALRLEERRRPPERLLVSAHPAPHRQRGGSVHLLDDDGLVAELRGLGGTGTGVLDNAALREVVLPAVRGDYRLIENYRPRAVRPLATPVVGLLADRDGEATHDEMSDWALATTGRFELRVFPGEHFYLVGHRHAVIEEILRGLRLPHAGRVSWPSTP